MKDKSMEGKFYVTTPIYYVNDVPHIGHAYTTVACDVLARFNRLAGRKVFFLTGTDEHGQKVSKAAEIAGKTPKDHADNLCMNFRRLWLKLGISNDAFIRTTDKDHADIVRSMLQSLYDKGEIEKRLYSGWYCTHDERFWTEKDIVDGNCPDCKRSVEQIEEVNYFFLMSKYQDRLIKYINDNADYIMPETRRNEVLGFLKGNRLEDLCISRPKKRLSWGISLPFDEEFVAYVWFDALINYYSATMYLAPDSGDVTWWPASHHIVGKDILTTHAVFWSTMLMALDIPLPGNIFAHGWWTVDGRKMSKSFGNVVDPALMIDRFGRDAFRYFLLREVTFGLDGDFSEAALVSRINSDLANDLGNLVSRSVAMTRKYFNGVTPDVAGIEPGSAEIDLKTLSEGVVRRIDNHLRELSYTKALDAVWEIVTFLNKYIDTTKPWTLAGKRESADTGDDASGGSNRLKIVMYSLLEGLRLISIYIYPFMPDTARKIYKALTGRDVEDINLQEEAVWGRLPHNRLVGEVGQLFPRIESNKTKDEQNPVQLQITQRGKKEIMNEPVQEQAAAQPLITIDDFAKVTLKTGKVVSAERVKNSDKLLKLQVDTGEMRQVVAGIAKFYSPEEIVGKTVIIVANLKPAKLMGVESQGMVLAASDGSSLTLLTTDKDAPGGLQVR